MRETVRIMPSGTAAHSPIAVKERTPAITAVTATATIPRARADHLLELLATVHDPRDRPCCEGAGVIGEDDIGGCDPC